MSMCIPKPSRNKTKLNENVQLTLIIGNLNSSSDECGGKKSNSGAENGAKVLFECLISLSVFASTELVIRRTLTWIVLKRQWTSLALKYLCSAQNLYHAVSKSVNVKKRSYIKQLFTFCQFQIQIGFDCDALALRQKDRKQFSAGAYWNCFSTSADLKFRSPSLSITFYYAWIDKVTKLRITQVGML